MEWVSRQFDRVGVVGVWQAGPLLAWLRLRLAIVVAENARTRWGACEWIDLKSESIPEDLDRPAKSEVDSVHVDQITNSGRLGDRERRHEKIDWEELSLVDSGKRAVSR